MSRGSLFRLLHVVWALPCVVATAVLVSATEGHPPGIVFAPVAVAVWLLGHLFLWLAHRLLRRGLTRVVAKGPSGGRTSWPFPVVLAIAGTGVLGFLAFVLTGALALNVDRLTVWSALTAGALWLHAPVFVGLLLRRGWARFLAAALSGFWALLMLYQIVDHLRRSGSVRIWEWPLSVTIVVCLSWLAWTLLTSSSVAAYFPAANDANRPS